MPRRRLGVVLLVPPPQSKEIDGIRRALSDPALARLPAHVTLVPPVNVAADRLDEALALVREAAGSIESLSIELGPVCTFAPVTPVLYLAVRDVDVVRRLQEMVLHGPLHRRSDHDFVPHVTIQADAGPAEMAAMKGLGGYTATVDISGITILEAESKSPRRWFPVADVHFGRPTVAGRGGIETVLHRGTIADPIAMERFPWAAGAGAGADVVVTAMRRGGLAGVATATRRDDLLVTEGIEVVESERRTGVGRALFDELRRIAGQAGLEATYARR